MLKVWPSAVASGAVTTAGVAVGLQEERWGLVGDHVVHR